ncbi:MAG: beta galactosidase jelly roll domain-containing protein, partial [Lentisphaeraceae bacterium]|nr:beta galactosidase jelly roll domain-containing protein [Lentisphaeraceae bacterium]
MRKFWLSCLLLLCSHVLLGSESPRTREPFNEFWSFARFGPQADGTQIAEDENIQRSEFDDSQWRQLDLPHDWAIEGPFRQDLPNRTGKLPWQGIGWYRKTFTVPAVDKGKDIFIDFDGAMSHAKVWLNGEYIGEWPYGYNSFRLELTEKVKFAGENVIAVRLENPPNSSRWYPGAGIYRNVWLVKMSPIHISRGGIFVRTPQVSSSEALLSIATELENKSLYKAKLRVEHRFYAPETTKPFKTLSKTINIAAGKSKTLQQQLKILTPQLWDISTAKLYRLQTSVYSADALIDHKKTNFGIRSAVFDANRGFVLNGRVVKLKGVCNHHDLGPLGSAINVRAIERRLELLKEMGCNAIRTAHNPFSPEFMDLCDRMGFLVVNELFDGWAKEKTPNDYSLHFDKWHEKDIEAFVKRDRNHPCVIMWSSGNEVRDGYFGKEKLFANSAMLRAVFLKYDASRPITVGCDNTWFGFGGFEKTVDVFGYNYKPHKYAEFHKGNPTIPIMGSETASCVSSRGEYVFPV